MQFVFYAAEALLQQVVERRVRKRIPLSDASHSFSSDLVNEHPERSLPPCLVYLIQFFSFVLCIYFLLSIIFIVALMLILCHAFPCVNAATP